MTKSDPGWCQCGWDTYPTEHFFEDPVWGWGSCDEPWFRGDRDVGEPVNECASGYKPTACWSYLVPYYNTCRDNCDCVLDNQPPTISDIPHQQTDGEPVSLFFTIGDVETPASSLSVTASSSDTILVPKENIELGGSGEIRSITVSPAAGETGTTIITVTVTDEGGLTAADTFVMTVYSLVTRRWEWIDIYFTSTTWGTEEDKFDRVATATFTHLTADPITTEMFYTGADNTWILRFTGTATGEWNFTTSSIDSELDNHSGTIIVTEPDPSNLGFMSQCGNKWCWEGADDEAFLPQYVMYALPDYYHGNPTWIDGDISDFFTEHGFNGFHAFVSCAWFNVNFFGDNNNGPCDPNDTLPDSATFDALEKLIDKVHQAGGLMHIWTWGDEGTPNQTPTPLPGGINGYVDKRLQRYIAARLGPLPGWSMGYGYDLEAWAGAPPDYRGDPTAVPGWHDYMQAHLGWPHFLGGRPGGPNSGTDHSPYIPWNLALDYSSYEHHKPSYAVYVAALNAIPDKPVFSEDRFRVRGTHPDKDYTEQETRRGLYHSAMAGGVGNIWGYLEGEPTNPCYANYYPDNNVCSNNYPSKHWIRTYSQVFEVRFKKDMERANHLLGGGNDPAGNGVALKNQSNSLLILYKENTNQITVDLSLMGSSASAVAIDTTLTYAEIPVYPSSGIISLPRLSDWVVVIECQCTPPAVGDWIVTESCTFTGTATAPANVIVQNNATLTVAADASLDIHFDTNYLLVKSGSGVRITDTGKVH